MEYRSSAIIKAHGIVWEIGIVKGRSCTLQWAVTGPIGP